MKIMFLGKAPRQRSSGEASAMEKKLTANLSPGTKIVFDSPPIIGVSDASVLASAVDGAILLIQHRRNPQSMVVRAQQILTGLKTPLLGVVLTQVPLNSGEDYGYYTNNYSYYGDGGKKRRKSASRGGKPTNSGDELVLKE